MRGFDAYPTGRRQECHRRAAAAGPPPRVSRLAAAGWACCGAPRDSTRTALRDEGGARQSSPHALRGSTARTCDVLLLVNAWLAAVGKQVDRIRQVRQVRQHARHWHAHGVVHQHGARAVEAVRAVHKHHRLASPRRAQLLQHAQAELVHLQRRRRAVRAGARHLDVAGGGVAQLVGAVVALRLGQVHHRRQPALLLVRRVARRSHRRPHGVQGRELHRSVAQHRVKAPPQRHFAGHEEVEEQRPDARAVQPTLWERLRVAGRVQRDVRGVVSLPMQRRVRVGASRLLARASTHRELSNV